MRLAWLLLLAACATPEGWSQPRRVAGPFALPQGEASDWGPVLSAGPDESALLVWVEESLVTSAWSIYASRLDNGAWATPARVAGGPGPLPLAARPVAALDHAGHAFVAWADSTGAWVARQPASKGWEEPLPLRSPDGAAPTLPALAASPDGRVLVVWGWSAPAQGGMASRWHHPARGWKREEALTEAPGPVHAPAIAFGPTGKAVVAWAVGGGRRDRLAIRRELALSGWGPVVPLPVATKIADPYRDACCWSFRGLRLSLAAPSTPLLVWEGRFRGAVGVVVPSLWAARLEGKQWRTERLDPGPQGRHLRDLSPPAFALAPDGSAVLVWAEAAAATDAGLVPAEVWGRHLAPAGGWDPAARLATLGERSVDGRLGARVAAIAPRRDEAYALWAEEGTLGWSLASSRWRPGIGWRPADNLAGPSHNRLAAPAIAAAGHSLVAVWLTGSEQAGWRLATARKSRR